MSDDDLRGQHTLSKWIPGVQGWNRRIRLRRLFCIASQVQRRATGKLNWLRWQDFSMNSHDTEQNESTNAMVEGGQPPESTDENSSSSASESAELPELPPVEPPSAGFIVQLFVVPGLIVLAIVAVWALFGQLASGQQDWKQLTTDLRSSNEHRRWRAANGLAQLLKVSQQKSVAQVVEGAPEEIPLTQNRQVAGELAKLLCERMDEIPGNKEEKEAVIQQQGFLAVTLGLMDVPDLVLPVLWRAMQKERDVEVRKNAIRSVAVILGRNHAKLKDYDLMHELTDQLVEVSFEEEPLFRQLAAFALGLDPSDEARERLVFMLDDADRNTAVNAAIGLTRGGSTLGLGVFMKVLQDAVEHAKKPLQSKSNKAKSNKADFEPVVVGNTLKAISQLAQKIPDGQKQELLALIDTLHEEYPEPRIRIDAKATSLALRK